MIKDKYKDIGLKLTPQRLAVLKYLEGNKSHPSAEDVYTAVKNRFSTISFATVYNILEALKKKGLIQELSIDPVRKRFDPDVSPHHHLICVNCGRIFDFKIECIPEIPEETCMGFEIKKVHMEIFGLCSDCKEMKK